MSSDYTTVGHVTADVLAGQPPRPGGGAFYSALQAARLGWRAKILTRGVSAEIERLLAPYRGELALEVIEAPATTTLQTAGVGSARSQRMLAWAGAIGEEIVVSGDVAHLAPVARETPARWRGSTKFVGVTPQGLVRSWPGLGAEVVPAPLERALLPARFDALVLSEDERALCATLLAERGASARKPPTEGPEQALATPLIAITAGSAATELRLPDGAVEHVPVPALARVCDDLGAGDVFAAAFFIALAEGRDARDAALFANAAAAVRVGGVGAGAVGDRAAVERRVLAHAEARG